MVIYDLPVHKPSEIGNLINRYGVEKILLAIPSASTEVTKTSSTSSAYPCEVLIIPGMKDLVDGKIAPAR